MKASRLVLCAALLAPCVAIAGCSSGEPTAGLDVREVHPVKGKVTVRGKPAGGAIIGLRPLADVSPYNPRAIAEPDGSFAITTYRRGDGAPPGEYLVTIYWPEARPKKKGSEEDDAGIDLPDRLGGRYRNPSTSPLRATVSPGENRVDFTLP